MNLISVIYSTTPHTGWQSSRVFSLEFYGAQEKPLIHPTPESSTADCQQLNHVVDSNQSLGLMEETDIA